MVAEGSNQSISYAAIFDCDSWFLSSKMSRFLIFNAVEDIDDSPSRIWRFLVVPVVDDLDDDFDAAERNDGEIDEDEFVDDREDTVEGVEIDGDDTTKDEPMTSTIVCVFLLATSGDLPFFAFFGKLLLLSVMIGTNVGFVKDPKKVGC